MKTTFKRIIAVILCAVIVIASTGTNTAYAATSKPPLKLKFNGKSINMVNVLENGNEETASIAEVMKKFGEPDKKSEANDLGTEFTEYVWEKGSSSIQLTNIKVLSNGSEYLGHFDVQLKGKNDALCGIKVGMKKAAVLKKLKKMFGKNDVCVAKEGQSIVFKKGKYIPKGKATGDGEEIDVFNAYSYVLTLGFYLKNGRVFSMRFAS